MQFAIAFIAWWLIGYAFALGDNQSEFIGQEGFGGQNWLYNVKDGRPSYFGLIGIFVIFIINGAISEKTKYAAYAIFPFCIMVFIWPVIVAWIWANDGWLTIELDAAIKDYGFTITIYVFAGAFSMIGAAFTGRRVGKYTYALQNPRFEMTHHVFYYIGAVLTIIGVFTINTDYNARVGSFSSTWIAGSASSIISLKLLTMFSVDLPSHFTAVYQGFIAGMVIISSSTNTEAWEAFFFGMLAGLVFSLGVRFSRWLQYDDVLNVVPTFFYPGLVGGILPGFIDNQVGVFWGGTSGNTLAVQVVGVVVVAAWATFWAIIVFGTMRAFGLLLLTDDIQCVGLEATVFNQHGFALKHEPQEIDIEEAKY